MKSGSTPSRQQTETRHHPQGRTCHHFVHHRLTCDEYDQLRARAAGRCELCRTPEALTGGKRLVVDHFSDQRQRLRFIRGLICDKCNTVMACLDGRKNWGENRRWEAQAREYEANAWQQPTAEQRALTEKVRTERRAYLLRVLSSSK